MDDESGESMEPMEEVPLKRVRIREIRAGLTDISGKVITQATGRGASKGICAKV